MTDPRNRVPSFDDLAQTAEEPEFASEYSKDYWDLVFEQLSKRVLFKVGVVVLTILYGVAVFAPLIANDRPLVIESVSSKEYEAAVRVLRPMTSAVARIAEQSDAEFAAALAEKGPPQPGAPRTRAEALEVEGDALALRIATMRSMLSEEDAAKLQPFLDDYERGMAAAADGPSEEGNAAFDEAKTKARALRSELKPLDPTDPDAGGLALLSKREYPLFDSIAPWEAALMALWLIWTTWPVWNWIVNRILLGGDRNRIRALRRVKVLGTLGLSFVGALAWYSTFGGVPEFDVSKHKAGLTSGEVVLLKAGLTTADLAAAGSDEAREALRGEVSWAPITMGFAELHEPEKFRPPTWHPKSEMDPETGKLVKAIEVIDPTTGQAPIANPPERRVGEPDINDASRHLLGTDESGRDIASRMIWGSRTSLSVGILSAALLTLIGVVIGSIAGFFGGLVDDLIMRCIEILQSIPAFFLILLALAFTDPETVPPMFAIVIVIAIVRWTGVARLVRGEFLRLREQEFVVAAQALGFSSRRTIFRHVLPNAMSPVLVAAAFSVAAGILTESAVSFLGFGISEPSASWGSIVNESKSAANWWIQVFPGIAIFVTVTCYNLVGDAIRDAMDPKMKV